MAENKFPWEMDWLGGRDEAVQQPGGMFQGQPFVPEADIQPWEQPWGQPELRPTIPEVPEQIPAAEPPVFVEPPARPDKPWTHTNKAPTPPSDRPQDIKFNRNSPGELIGDFLFRPIETGIGMAAEDFEQSSRFVWGKPFNRGPTPVMAQPTSMKELQRNPREAIPKLFTQGVRFFPAVAASLAGAAATGGGSVIATMAGAGAGGALATLGQSLGVNAEEAFARFPDDPEAAYQQTIATTAIDTGFSIFGTVASGFNPFGNMLRNMLAQTFVIQPGIGLAGLRAHNEVAGLPDMPLEDELLNLLGPSFAMAAGGQALESIARGGSMEPWQMPWKGREDGAWEYDPEVQHVIPEAAPEGEAPTAQTQRADGPPPGSARANDRTMMSRPTFNQAADKTVVTSLTPEERVQHSALIDETTKAILEIAPKANIHAVSAIDGGTVDGAMVQNPAVGKLILFAVMDDQGNSRGDKVPVTGRHEAWHWLEENGLVKEDELTAVREFATEQDWHGQHKIGERYPDLSADDQMSEAIADGFSQGRPTRFAGYPELVRKAFLRIDGLLTKIAVGAKRAFGKAPTAEQVFRLVETGEIGRRQKIRYRGQPENLQDTRAAPPLIADPKPAVVSRGVAPLDPNDPNNTRPRSNPDWMEGEYNRSPKPWELDNYPRPDIDNSIAAKEALDAGTVSRTMYQRGMGDNRPPAEEQFYYKSERVMRELDMKRASAEQWEATLRQKGVKQEEMEDLGLASLFEDKKGVYTREQIQSLIDLNKAEFVDVNLGSTVSEDPNSFSPRMTPLDNMVNPIVEKVGEWAQSKGMSPREVLAMKRKAKEYFRNPDLDWDNMADLPAEILNEMNDVTDSNVKWGGSEYTTPGGVSYHEMVLTLPKEEGGGHADHWEGMQGVVGHVRFAIKIGLDGKKIIEIFELQSDVHNKGKETGYQRPATAQAAAAKAELEAIRARHEKLRQAVVVAERKRDSLRMAHNLLMKPAYEIIDKTGRPVRSPPGKALIEMEDWARSQGLDPYNIKSIVDENSPEILEVKKKLRVAEKEAADLHFEAVDLGSQLVQASYNYTKEAGLGGAWSAPFKKTWHELALKKVLRWAAENGVERITWNSGDIVANRFGSDKGGKGLMYAKGADDKYTVAFEGYNDYDTKVDRGLTLDDVKERYGAKAAAAMAAGKGDTMDVQRGTSFGDSTVQRITRDTIGTDIMRKAVGKRSFYDKIIPQFFSKYGKKFGGKVGREMVPIVKHAKDSVVGTYVGPHKTAEAVMQLKADRAAEWDALPYVSKQSVDDYVAELLKGTAPEIAGKDMREGAADFLDGRVKKTRESGALNLQSFEITPAMRDFLLNEGQSYYQRPKAEAQPPDGQMNMSDGGMAQATKVSLSREERVKHGRMLKEMERSLKKTAPHAKVVFYKKLTLDEPGRGRGDLPAMYMPESRVGPLIILALEVDGSPNPNLGMSRWHENWHALEESGLVRPHEVRSLQEYAQKSDWISKYDISNRYRDDAYSTWLKEATAEGVGDILSARDADLSEYPRPIRRILVNIRRALRGLARTVRRFQGEDVTAEAVIDAIYSGKIGGRAYREGLVPNSGRGAMLQQGGKRDDQGAQTGPEPYVDPRGNPKDVRYPEPDRATVAPASSTGNRAKYKGKPFWSGVFDKRDGHIIATYPFEVAEAADFHHSMYMGFRARDAMAGGDGQFFWIDDAGRVRTEWRDGAAPQEIVKAIKSQITSMDGGVFLQRRAKEGEPITVYHGGNITGDIRTPLFVSPDRPVAETYARDRRGRLSRMTITPEKLADRGDLERVARQLKFDPQDFNSTFEMVDPMQRQEAPEIIKALREEGFDAVLIRDDASMDDPFTEVESYAILNPGIIKRDPTMLQRKQWSTPEFKVWFGKSQAVDRDGNPLVVYHGTDAEPFSVFDTQGAGAWFAESRRLAEHHMNKKSANDDRRVYEAYIRAEKPFRIPMDIDLSDSFDLQEALDRVNEENGTSLTREDVGFQDSADHHTYAFDYFGINDDFFKAIRKLGFDSVHAYEEGESTWNVLKANQVKSATENNGKFSRKKNDIYAQRAHRDTPEFKEYSKGLPVVEDGVGYLGGPAVFTGYHGTTHSDITEFKPTGNPQSWLGLGPYITTSSDDASQNYAGMGPDLQSRIVMEIDNITAAMDEDHWSARDILEEYFTDTGKDIDITDENLDDLVRQHSTDAADHIATARIKGDSDGLVMPLYVKLENPADATGTSKPLYLEREYNEDGDIVSESGPLLDWMEAAQDVVGGAYGAPEIAGDYITEILDSGDQMGMDELYRLSLKHLDKFNNDDGETLTGGAIFREIAEAAGYDGVIMDADTEFGSGRRGFGGVPMGMAGVTPGTMHIVPFNMDAIKSSIGNSGAYGKTKKILAQRAHRETPEFKRWFGNSHASKEFKPGGEAVVVYRGEHGDSDAFIQSRLPSITATDNPDIASLYAMTPNQRGDRVSSPRVSAYYAKIENPLFVHPDDPFLDLSIVEEKLGREAAEAVAKKLELDVQNTSYWQEDLGERYTTVEEAIVAEPDTLGKMYVTASKFLDDPEFVQMAKDAGYDGAIHLGWSAAQDAIEYRVFDEGQLKSATGNNGQYSSARNVLLQRRHWNTPEFKEYFDGSKVANKRGDPKPVYHGTASDITVPGSTSKNPAYADAIPLWFGEDTRLAHAFLGGGRRGGHRIKKGSNILAAYLSIKNPLDLTSLGDNAVHKAISTRELFRMAGIPEDKMIDAANKVEEWAAGARSHYQETYHGPMFGHNGFTSLESNVNTFLNDTQRVFEHLDNPGIIRVLKEQGFDGVKATEKAEYNPTLAEGRRLNRKLTETVSSVTWAPFEPNQIKSVYSNNGNYSREASIMAQRPKDPRTPPPTKWKTADTTKIIDLDPPEYTVTVGKVGRQLELMTKKINGGKALDPTRPADHSRIVSTALAEARNQYLQKDHGANWYDSEISEAFRLSAYIVPRLAHDEVARSIMSVMAAITSNGNRAGQNWRYATLLMEVYDRTGNVVDRNPSSGEIFGQKGHTIALGLRGFDRMIKDMGELGATEWLLTHHTVAEINQMRQKLGWKAKIPGKMSDRKIGAFIFGPKIGPFLLNIHGVREATIDSWMVRQWGRYVGRLTSGGQLDAQGLRAQPRTPAERQLIIDMVNQVAKALKIKPQDAQALLWYYEQRLYRSMGAKSARSESFTDGARKELDLRNIKDITPKPAKPARLAGRNDAPKITGPKGRGPKFQRRATSSKGTPAPAADPPRVEKPIRVYHSSPYEFANFDITKMGAGEGSQAFGPGLYFAEASEVSGQGGAYWNIFIDRMPAGPERLAAHWLRGSKFDREKAAAKLEHDALYFDDQAIPGRYGHGAETEEGMRLLAKERRDAAELLRSGKPVGPRTYEVDLHVDPERDLIHWDKTLADQPHILKKLKDNAHLFLDALPLRRPGVLQQMMEGEGVNQHTIAAFYNELHHNLRSPAKALEEMRRFNKSVHPNVRQSYADDIDRLERALKKNAALAIDESAQPVNLLKGGASVEERVERAKSFVKIGIKGVKFLDRVSREAGHGTHNYVMFDDKLIEKKAMYQRPRKGKPEPIEAWHASPYNFDKFKLSSKTIGTGEGSQSRGHGLYYAGEKATSDEYFKLFKDDGIAYTAKFDDALAALNDLGVDGQIADEMITLAYEGGFDPQVEHLSSFLKGMPDMDPEMLRAARVKGVAPIVNKLVRRTNPTLYRVNLFLRPDQILDWDEPLKNQDPGVQDALHKAWLAHKETQAEQTGERIYQEAGRDLTRASDRDADIVATEAMKRAGIKAVRFMDRFSRYASGGTLVGVEKTPEGYRSKIRVDRGNDNGMTWSKPYPTEQEARDWAQKHIERKTYNYVLFDTRLVKILEKFAVPMVIGLGGLMMVNSNDLPDELRDQFEAAAAKGSAKKVPRGDSITQYLRDALPFG